ncbi:MAG: Holliday junction resolvase RuvX [Alphaproteobacteria bacterium]
MILLDFKVFPKKGRILSVDWGAQRTGIAVSDYSREMFFVRDAIVGKNNIDEIVKILNSESFSGIVIGLPLCMDGTESETTKKVREFAEKLTQKTELPIILVDETLSSMSAQESMGRVRVSDIKHKLDSESARVILENAVSILNRL